MKGAVEVLTRYMAKELGTRGIAVNTVSPGAIATDFSGGMVLDNPDVNKRVAEMTALGRAGEPDDIGPMIAAPLADDNQWINGQRIDVSSGMVLQAVRPRTVSVRAPLKGMIFVMPAAPPEAQYMERMV